MRLASLLKWQFMLQEVAKGSSAFLKVKMGWDGVGSSWSWKRSEISSKPWLGKEWHVQHHFQRSPGLLVMELTLALVPILMAKKVHRHMWKFCAKASVARRRRVSPPPPHPMVSLRKDHCVRPKKGKKQFRTVHSLGKDLSECWGLDEVMGVSRLPKMATQSHPNTRGKPECSKVYAHASAQSNISIGYQLTSKEDTFSLLSLWRSQLEKLKADMDRALCCVSEWLLLFRPGSKPSGIRRKRKKDTKKKMGRLRWVPKIVKPKPSASNPELAVFPKMGSMSKKIFDDSERSLVTPETTGGVSSLVGFGKPDTEMILEVRKGPPESIGCIPAVSKIAGGSPFSLVVPALVSMVSQSEQSSRADFSSLVLRPKS
jgi:hypothetical protein